jgi:hypothetical protein
MAAWRVLEPLAPDPLTSTLSLRERELQALASSPTRGSWARASWVVEDLPMLRAISPTTTKAFLTRLQTMR